MAPSQYLGSIFKSSSKPGVEDFFPTSQEVQETDSQFCIHCCIMVALGIWNVAYSHAKLAQRKAHYLAGWQSIPGSHMWMVMWKGTNRNRELGRLCGPTIS